MMSESIVRIGGNKWMTEGWIEIPYNPHEVKVYKAADIIEAVKSGKMHKEQASLIICTLMDKMHFTLSRGYYRDGKMHRLIHKKSDVVHLEIKGKSPEETLFALICFLVEKMMELHYYIIQCNKALMEIGILISHVSDIPSHEEGTSVDF